MVDLTKKKHASEYGTGALIDGDTVITYRSTNAVGERVLRGDIVAGTAASIADGTSTALKMYSDKELKDSLSTGAIPVGTDTEIETGTDTTAKLYAPDQLNSAIDSLIETAVPDGTEAQIIAGTDTTERKFTPADINGAVKDIAVAQYTGRTAMKAATGLSSGDVVYLSEGGRSGTFEYLVGDYSAEVAADTLEGVYVELDGVDASVGVLKRVLNGYVTPEMFGGGESGFKAALASGYNVKDGESEYTITSLATLPNDKVVALVAVTGANAENVRYAPDGSDTTLIAVDIDCTSGIALHQNQPNSMDQITALSKIKSDGYAFLSNNNSDGSDGYILALNYLHSEDADAIELNHPDENSSHFSTIGNIVETGNSLTSGTAGFGVGIAGTQGHITALNHCRLSRNEAYHIEDGQRRGILLGNTGLTELHGVLVLPPKVSDGEAHGPLVIANHLEESTGTKTGKYGLYSVVNTDGSIEHAVFLGNHLDGFERGISAGSKITIADSNVLKDVDYACRVTQGGRLFGTNYVRGECNSFSLSDNRTIAGKFISDTAPTGNVIEFVGGSTQCGSILKGFSFPVAGTHTGSGSNEIVATLPVAMDGNTLLKGRMSISSNGSNYSVSLLDVSWDGSTLTVDRVTKSNGGAASTTLVVSSGYLCVQMFSNTSLNNEITIDFEGYYYQEA